MATELCALLAPDSSVRLLADPSDIDLLDWWRANPFNKRIEIIDQPIPCRQSMTGAALIVNSACQHRSAIEAALSAGYNVVSEKPLTFSRHESLQLLHRADELGLKLLSTNTFCFAEYLHVFKQNWLQGNALSEVHLTWADATNEIRHGHTKAYDSSVPVIFDVLPHVACIVLATCGEIQLERAEVTVSQGGSSVTVRFVCNDLTICADMSRNSTRRVRFARFSGPEFEVAIDFTDEPGVVFSGRSAPVTVDPAWRMRRRPLSEMLCSLKAYFESGETDDRLSPKAALLGNDMIDRVADSYVQQQIGFLSEHIRLHAPLHSTDFEYAVKEAHSLRERALHYLPQESPLRRLAMFALKDTTSQPEFDQSGRASR